MRGALLEYGTGAPLARAPVIRGHWILENMVGTPPPPPPDEVPALEDNNVDQTLPMRERLSQHRANKACAVCHDLMDPVGFALERRHVRAKGIADLRRGVIDESEGLGAGHGGRNLHC